MKLHDLKNLFTEDRAVSPVIGVILMVAITVILAAVIGTFVLGLGDDLQNTQPTASFNFDFETNDSGNDSVTISHGGGDSISSEDTVTVAVTGGADIGNSSDGGNESSPFTWTYSDSLSAGSSQTFYLHNESDSGSTWNGETVSVNWESADGSSSAQLGSQDAPTV
ncbi:flagellin N-terminal-like domain-containing protein [Halopenitus malekzadehii]|uniref:Flagellin N-terminal-like domain-containing protein n=1 Tax=Halopenitus malekzadehii TaxID=1267564 RepID=A0A1H6JC39_9EURY|nr:type IV pilin N-terminal domain-containing protein [Halopenitus malekzadehii]SEH59850.1 flagellin N-terminal-like domain-containing protein [Halopenitus malekzadehii]